MRKRPVTIKAKPRNRAAQDATLINLRALKRRVAKLEAWADRMADMYPSVRAR